MTKNDGERYKARVRAYQRLFNSEDGKVVLRDLASRHYIWSAAFSENDRIAAFREGQRNVILFIMKKLHMNLEELSQMIQEVDNEYGTGAE